MEIAEYLRKSKHVAEVLAEEAGVPYAQRSVEELEQVNKIRNPTWWDYCQDHADSFFKETLTGITVTTSLVNLIFSSMIYFLCLNAYNLNLQLLVGTFFGILMAIFSTGILFNSLYMADMYNDRNNALIPNIKAWGILSCLAAIVTPSIVAAGLASTILPFIFALLINVSSGVLSIGLITALFIYFSNRNEMIAEIEAENKAAERNNQIIALAKREPLEIFANHPQLLHKYVDDHLTGTLVDHKRDIQTKLIEIKRAIAQARKDSKSKALGVLDENIRNGLKAELSAIIQELEETEHRLETQLLIPINQMIDKIPEILQEIENITVNQKDLDELGNIKARIRKYRNLSNDALDVEESIKSDIVNKIASAFEMINIANATTHALADIRRELPDLISYSERIRTS